MYKDYKWTIDNLVLIECLILIFIGGLIATYLLFKN